MLQRERSSREAEWHRHNQRNISVSIIHILNCCMNNRCSMKEEEWGHMGGILQFIFIIVWLCYCTKCGVCFNRQLPPWCADMSSCQHGTNCSLWKVIKCNHALLHRQHLCRHMTFLWRTEAPQLCVCVLFVKCTVRAEKELPPISVRHTV